MSASKIVSAVLAHNEWAQIGVILLSFAVGLGGLLGGGSRRAARGRGFWASRFRRSVDTRPR
jgi:hypothetical protein